MKQFEGRLIKSRAASDSGSLPLSELSSGGRDGASGSHSQQQTHPAAPTDATHTGVVVTIDTGLGPSRQPLADKQRVCFTDSQPARCSEQPHSSQPPIPMSVDCVK